MRRAPDYPTWRECAERYDRELRLDRWRSRDRSREYDYVAIRMRLDQLRTYRARHDNHGLLYSLLEGIHGNIGGMGRAALYGVSPLGTKQLIADYIEEVAESLLYLASDTVDDIDTAEKHVFFARARQCFGHTALMLSGAGSLLYFHIGVLKAMHEHNLLPEILSGSSGGAFVGALVATRTADELAPIFDPEVLVYKGDRGRGRVVPQLMQPGEIANIIETLIPDLTFEEAHQRSGLHLNVSVAAAERHQTSRLLNAVTTPHVYIREAVRASGAVPGVYPPVVLMARDRHGDRQPYLPSRRWVDGSVSDDLPAKRLSRLYGVNHYIVSQTNPHVLPFISDGQRLPGALSALRYAGVRSGREWLNAGASIVERSLSRQQHLQQWLSMGVSIINQDYVGDINILPPFRFRNPYRLLAHASQEEISELMLAGQRSAWPRLEMIRLQTLISRALRDIPYGQPIQPG